MVFGGESEVHDLANKFKDSVELGRLNGEEKENRRAEKEKRKGQGRPFRAKFEESLERAARPAGASMPSAIDKLHSVELELSRLKEMQSEVLDMRNSMEATIEREVTRAKEREARELRAKFKAKIKEIERTYMRREEELKVEYEEKLARIAAKMKEKVKELVSKSVQLEVEKAKKASDRKLLEARVRDKGVIDKLTQMYVDLKDKYRRDVQGLGPSASLKGHSEILSHGANGSFKNQTMQ